MKPIWLLSLTFFQYELLKFYFNMKTYNLTHNGSSYKARLLKSAKLSTGYLVFLFEREVMKGLDKFVAPYIVAVKSPIDSTAEWMSLPTLSRGCSYYLDMICLYA